MGRSPRDSRLGRARERVRPANFLSNWHRRRGGRLANKGRPAIPSLGVSRRDGANSEPADLPPGGDPRVQRRADCIVSCETSLSVRARLSNPGFEVSLPEWEGLSDERRPECRSVRESYKTGEAVPRRRGIGRAVSRRRVIWLILPVAICLSQRLSHACPSTSLIKVKPRMAH